MTSAEAYYNGQSMNMDSYGPLDPNPMTLVLCLDGTQNEFGPLPFSNSLKLFRLLNKDDPSQLCYYQPGVGVKFGTNITAYDPKNIIGSTFKKVGRQLDSVFAYTFQLHVKAAYIFLMRFYREGDKICLIGFSRGSFAARILAGMLESIGLLNKGLEDMVSTAWEIYSNWENAGQPSQEAYSTSLLLEFKETFCRSKVQIHFMGLFDSVNSVGLFRDRMFPYTSSSSIVSHVRHAVSLDERRGKFKQVLFQPFSYYPHLTDLEYEECQDDVEDTRSLVSLSMNYFSRISDFLHGVLGRKPKRKVDDDCTCQDIKEVWFPGNHGDVGGGWVPDEGTNQCLSNVSLRWMLAEALKFGISFKPGAINEFSSTFPIAQSFLSYNHDLLAFQSGEPVSTVSRITLPQQALYGNMRSGNNSVLQTLFWWVIELLPIGIKIEDENGKWKNIYIPNIGRLRKVPQSASLHWSVFYRLHYFEDYTPQNLPRDLGYAFIESVKWMKSKEYITSVDEYAVDLTMERIKSDWSTGLWHQIPDELEELIKQDSSL